MNVLVACEYSGRVREAFRKRGHDAWSCDLLPSEDNGPFHHQGDVRAVMLSSTWDLIIAHPPCTDLASSGARWWKSKDPAQMQASADFFHFFTECTNYKWAIENPIGRMSKEYRKPDQIIQPWQFGHGETKATCLWLNGLPLLKPTNIVEGREAKCHRMSPGPDRWKDRSRTYTGVAEAMAAQWSDA